MPSNFRHWEDLSGRDFLALDPARVVVTVSCSPLEVHGPHLPVKTDYFEAEGLTKRMIEIFAKIHPEILFLRLPPIYVSTDVVPQPGSLQFRGETIVSVLSDLGRSLCRQGFPRIWVASFHGGPRHFLAIEIAADKVNRRYGGQMISMFSLLASRLTSGTADGSRLLSGIDGLTSELLAGDTHGGVVETSLMLHLTKQSVDDRFQELEQRTVDLKRREAGKGKIGHDSQRTGILDRIQAFVAALKFFEDESYAGAPSAATPEIGAAVLELFATRSADIMGEVWRGEIGPRDCHSPLWPYRHLFMSRIVAAVLERLVGYRTQVW